ncbi:MAG TPA: family 16 glycoside hydrolase [Steroidobacteraceae bacterium]|jgi:hypothetical protein|nr:family 16 glycoside hydrolase [Steroidobacteraceae bacterium]
MNARLTVLLALIPLLPLQNAFAQTDQEPPTAFIVGEGFQPIRNDWVPVSGTWTVAGGTYGSSAAGAADLNTITSYRGLHPAAPPDTELRYQEFFVRALMRNQGTADSHLVGLVYGYQNPQNYYEVVISALGNVRARTVLNGVAVDEAPAVHQAIPRNTWFEVEARWSNGTTTVQINGATVGTFSQPEFTTGQIGLVTHGAVGRFDNVLVGVPFGDQNFLETFADPPFVTFTPQSGQWSVVNKTYRNSAVQQTNVTLAPIHTGVNVGDGETFQYTFRARMLNPYGASGNLIGIVFNYKGSEYTEVVFSPTGVAKLNLVQNGVVAQTLATANYGGHRNVAFEVKLENSPPFVSVSVDGTRIFDNVGGANPNLFAEGGVGLITHWAPGRFDNVEFSHSIFAPCSLTFDEFPLFSLIVSGTWDTVGGTLNATSAGSSDIVDFRCTGTNFSEDREGNNAVYSARLLNQYGASGNLIGLLYNYQGADYYEVVFSPTGILQLNKFIEGERTTVRTATHNIPRNTWFDVQVIRNGIRTTVKLNGATLVDGQVQGELRGGSTGVITHWSKGRFDDVSLTPDPSRPPSEL